MDKRDKFPRLGFSRIFTIGLISFAIHSCHTKFVGQITNEEKVIIDEEARMTLTQIDTDKINDSISLKPNGQGHFEFKGLKKGTYLVEIIVPGYKLKSIKKELSPNETVTFNLTPLTTKELTIYKMQKSQKAAKGDGKVMLNLPVY